MRIIYHGPPGCFVCGIGSSTQSRPIVHPFVGHPRDLITTVVVALPVYFFILEVSKSARPQLC